MKAIVLILVFLFLTFLMAPTKEHPEPLIDHRRESSGGAGDNQ